MEPKYNRIGIGYNTTRKADPYLSKRLIEHLAPKPKGLYLDIGCGTGNYTQVLHENGLEVIAIDPFETMLEKARSRNDLIDWRKGMAEQIDLANSAVDGIIATLTIHHWSDLNAAFSELSRVLRQGGKLVIFTSTPEQMEGYWLNHYFPKMLRESTVQMPGLEKVEEAMNRSGLTITATEKYFVKPDLQDKFLQCGKYDPEMYFDENIRRGISTFSAIAHETEVEQGLEELRSDIDSGKVKEVMNSFENDLGDYLYIIGKKA